MTALSKIRPVSWIKVGSYSLLLLLVYYSSLAYLIHLWHGDYSYCLLIPFVILYLIWDRRNRLVSIPSMPTWMGLMPLGFGVVLFWIGELGGEYLTLFLSFWLATVGLCWIHLGWKKLKAIAFALAMIVTMFPLPTFVYRNISVKLQLISTRIGVLMMRLYGMSAYREGNVIDLGFTQLQVVDVCSGLRYFFPLTVLGLLIAYFFRGTLWKKATLVVSTLPLSILTNSLRIALTGILYENFGARVAEGFFHGFSGWFIFISSLAVLLLQMWILKRIFVEGKAQASRPKAQGRDNEDNALAKNPLTSNLEPQTNKGLLALARPPQFIVAVMLLGAALIFSQGINFRERIPIRKPFHQFPLQLEEWSGIRQTMDQHFVDNLDCSGTR